MGQNQYEPAVGRADGRHTLPIGYGLTNRQNGKCYQIARVLGGGGFGITYEAMDSNGIRVAVKEFFPSGLTVRSADYTVRWIGDLNDMQAKLHSFSKETSVLIALGNIPSVVKIYDVFQTNQTAYYVMEYIEGSTMLDRLKHTGLMDPEQGDPAFTELMHSIEVLHNHGIIHRDITPDNIMVLPDGSFKLIDFGSARAYVGEQKLTVHLKDPFAPMEQYSPSGQGRYTDVYSLAATMLYAYTGKLVPRGKDLQKRETELELRLRNAGIRTDQIHAIKKALEVNPANRYQSMAAFAEAYRPEDKRGNTDRLPVNEQEMDLQARMIAALKQAKDRPGYLVAAGALLGIALVVQLLM